MNMRPLKVCPARVDVYAMLLTDSHNNLPKPMRSHSMSCQWTNLFIILMIGLMCLFLGLLVPGQCIALVLPTAQSSFIVSGAESSMSPPRRSRRLDTALKVSQRSKTLCWVSKHSYRGP